MSQAFVSLLCLGKKVPGERLRAKLSTLYQIAPDAWEEPGEGTTSAPSASLLLWETCAQDGKDVVERARILLAFLMGPERTRQELDQAREIRAALALEARAAGETTKLHLHEHPEWPAFVDGLNTAIKHTRSALDALEGSLRRTEQGKAA